MIDIDEDSLREGVLGLVIALVEIIRDALRLQGFKRMEGGSLSEEEIERLGAALMDLDVAIEDIKEDYGITTTVRQVRDGLDDIVNDVIDQFINPRRWEEERK
ncbi:MAG: gas vesicle protein K [Dehalococcoidia bacterium]